LEEVMRDEMMSMKLAFEMKLKSAKDESEMNSKRHAREIHLSPMLNIIYHHH
jgi:hypothetical protein